MELGAINKGCWFGGTSGCGVTSHIDMHLRSTLISEILSWVKLNFVVIMGVLALFGARLSE